MSITNIEFKARVSDPEKYENMLLTLNPLFIGTDHQVDTYFNAAIGRLKLREGNIENALIHYERDNIAGSKKSAVILYKHQPNVELKEILIRQFGIKTIVDKMRRIYFIGNVKFHFDTVATLGTFIEVEAIDSNGEFAEEQLKQQCNKYFEFFGLSQCDLVDRSYSDLIIDNGQLTMDNYRGW
jgi:predicted adenylyl cyclase CyaB